MSSLSLTTLLLYSASMPHRFSLSPMTFSPRPVGSIEAFDWVQIERQSTNDHAKYSYAVSSEGIEVQQPIVNQSITLPTHDKNDGRFSSLASLTTETTSCPETREGLLFPPKDENGVLSSPLALRRGKQLPLAIELSEYESSDSEQPISSRTNNKTELVHHPFVVDPAYDIVKEIGNDSEGPVSTPSPGYQHYCFRLI